VLSIEVTGLTMKACCTQRRDDPISYWGQGIVACAGPPAEQKFAGYPQDVQDRLWVVFWKTDGANVEYWLNRINGVTLAQAEAMARYLVDEHWDAIVRVAESLAAEGELGGARIEALLQNPS
jgi:hypothetical protein